MSIISRAHALASIVCVLLLVLSGCTQVPVVNAPDQNEIVKSPNDDREYRHIVLDNGLRVVLISDMEADKSAAALTAFRGSFDNPAERPGLAHFLEHMLFIGTEKYPEPDGYFSFVQSHGGNSNAYTASEHTNYFFDIQPEYFHEGLDRFAQFFISPIFAKEYAEREKNAVNSEYQLQLKEDGWRGFSVQKVTTNPAHPFSTFSIGSLETLAGDVQGALLKFFAENYSANQMGLVVLTNESLDEMEPWVTQIFAAIPNRNLEPVERSIPLYIKGQLPATLSYQSIRAEHSVSYDFPLPSLLKLYRIKPAQYIANLLGHEGDGSLHKLLVNKGWITALGASDGDIDEFNSIMSINIELTPEGVNHLPEITAHLFNYLAMVRKSNIQEWLYEEQARVAELGFRFREKSQALSVVSGLAPELQHYPARDLLVAPYLMEEFKPEAILSFLAMLRADNVLMTLSGPDMGGEQTEKWFKVPYDLSPGPIAMAEVDSSALHLPVPNPFVPDSLDLQAADTDGPKAVTSGDVEIYYDKDVEFGVPRAVTHVSLRNPGGLIELDDVAMADLYTRLVQDDLNALAYPALIAGVSYQIASPPKGFRLSIGGYHDKQLLLLDEVLTRLMSLQIDESRFDVIKAEVLRDLANSLKNRPYQQAYGQLRVELVDASWSAEDLMESVSRITLPALVKWRDTTLGKTSVQAMLLGNIDKSRVSDLLTLLRKYVHIAEVAPSEAAVATLDATRVIDLNVDHDDAAMVLYVQDEGESNQDRAKSALLVHLVRSGYFSSLRTEQQLGYVVSAANPVLLERGGVGFIIQSPVAPVAVLRERTLAYMVEQEQKLTQMTDDEFASNKDGLITQLTQKDKNLAERGGRYWSDLDRGITTFDSQLQLADEVSKLDKATVVAFLKSVNARLQTRYLMIVSQGRFAQAAAQMPAQAQAQALVQAPTQQQASAQ